MSRHLHRDYHTTFCGRDASHIDMTYDESAADCKACHTALGKHRAAEAARVAEEERKEEEHRSKEEALHRHALREAELAEKELAEVEAAKQTRLEEMERRLNALEGRA